MPKPRKNAASQTPPAEKRWHFWAAVATLVIVPFILYWPSMHAPFIFDDLGYITENTAVKHNLTKYLLDRVVKDDVYSVVASRPIVFVTLRMNYLLGGLNVGGYHLTNIILHVMCTLVVFILSLRILAILNLNRRLAISTMIGFLFAIHPINSEVAAYISHRSESIATFFYLTVLLCFTFESNVLLITGALLFTLGLLSKETVATIPVMLLLLDYFILSNRDASAIVKHRFRHGLFWAILLGFLLARYFIQGQLGDMAQVTNQVWTPILYFGSQIEVVLKYIGLLLLPLGLCLDHWISPVSSLYDMRVILSFSVLCMLLLGIYVIFRRDSTLNSIGFFSILWFIITISPTSSFLPINDAMAERRMYLPQYGFWLLMICIFGAVFAKLNDKSSKVMLMLCAVSYCSFLSFLTWKRSIKYQDPMILWSEAAEKYPNNYRALENVGFMHYLKGNYTEAIKSFHASINAGPRYSGPRYNLGNIYFDLGELKTAQYYYEEEIKLHPSMGAAINNLGLLYFKQGNLRKAEELYHQAISINPLNADAYGNLGNLYISKGLPKLAIENYENAVKVNPDLIKIIQPIIQKLLQVKTL